MSSSPETGLSEALSAALARLDSFINWERRDRADLERSLDPVAKLLEQMGNPHRAWRSVHVTGTKGKSSTASLVALGLELAGHRTGSYSSPHVERVTERARINRSEADDDALARSIECSLEARNAAATDNEAATFFDVLTAAAFHLFTAEKATWAAIECGLGGRLDSTNVIQSEVSIITNIDLEHTETLGSTRAAIAREKVGILKEESVLVTGIGPDDFEVWPVFAAAATKQRAELISVDVDGKSLLETNLALAQAALDALGRRGFRTAAGELIDASLIDEQLARAHSLPGRMEILSHAGVRLVLDGAHVASSVTRVLDESSLETATKPICILALRKDKDHRAVLKTLHGRVDRVVCTSLDSAPFRSASELEATAREIGLTATAAKDPRGALTTALNLAASDGWVLAIGSLYLAGAIRHELGDA